METKPSLSKSSKPRQQPRAASRKPRRPSVPQVAEPQVTDSAIQNAQDHSYVNGSEAPLDSDEQPAAARPQPKPAGMRFTPDLLPFLFRDQGNACRLKVLHGKDLRYCHAFRKWLVWDGMRWAIDDTDQARRLAKQTMLEFLRQAMECRNEEAEKFGRSSLDARPIANMLSMAESEIYIRPADLDTDPYALNFLNGTVDLRTSKLRPHNCNDYITKLIHHRYVPSASCDRWIEFLREVMGATPEANEEQWERAERLVDYLQTAIGYSLTGSTIEKAVFILFGDGNNGKSTLLSTISQLVEEYSCLLQADTLMARQESNNTQADLADLRGARFVQTSETEEGQRLAQGKLKRITQGMGKIKAVRKYENPIEFPETHHVWMDTNRKPTIRDPDDKATLNRLHPVPFTVSIPADRIDRELPAKLLREAEGILAWIVAGAKFWHERGLIKPPEVDAAKEAWRAEMDKLGTFIADCCVVRPEALIQASLLYGAYKDWAKGAGEKDLLTATTFGTKLTERGFEKQKKEKGSFYLGIEVAGGPLGVLMNLPG
jgi:putative DNA primase/helicase